jgi:two-component SAPR family response regulator
MQLKPKVVSIHNVDLYFFDIEMPVISGFDFRWFKTKLKSFSLPPKQSMQ